MNPFYQKSQARSKTAIRAEVPAVKQGEKVATIRLYDPIDSWGEFWGVSSKEFARALDDVSDDVSEVRLLINSPGGDVWEGLAILNQLRLHPARTVAVVEGIAASSASFIAAGCDEVVMMPNSEMFVHNAWGFAMGNSADMIKFSETLDHSDRNIASIYAAKAGGDVDSWLAVMGEEVFYSADEAVAAGLADRVEGEANEAASNAKARFDLSVLTNRGDFTPAASIGERVPNHIPPASEPGQPTHQKMEDDMSFDSLKAGLRERLGISDATLDEDGLLAALDETLTEQAEPTPAPVAQLPDGVVTIEASVLDELRAAAGEVRDIREERAAERRGNLVAAAVADGRIAPARKDHWLKALKADEEGVSAQLASLEPGLAVPLAEVGHSDEVETADDALLAKVAGTTPAAKEAN